MATVENTRAVHMETAKRTLAEDPRPTDDLEAGLFFDDASYLESLPDLAKDIICYLQMLPMAESGDRPFVCWLKSSQYLSQYKQSKAADDLESSVAFAALSLRYVLPDHPGRPISNWQMGSALQARWERCCDVGDLDQCIRHYRKAALKAEPGDGSETLSAWKCDLYAMLRHRYKITRRREDLVEAREAIDRAIELSGTSPFRAVFLANKAGLLLMLAKDSEPPDENALREAVDYSRQSTDLCDGYLSLPLMRPQLPYDTIYQEACQAQVALFRITRLEEDCSASISMCSRVQARYQVGSEAHKKLAAAAVSMFIARSEVLGVSITDDREWPRYLSEQPPDTPAKVSVAEHFIDKASNALDLGDRSLAGTYLEEARVLLRDHSPEFMSSNGDDIMHQLGVHASICFRMHGARASADEAVSFFEIAVKCSRGSPFRHHFALTEILTDRIRTYPDPKSAAKALEHATAAQGTCPLGDLALRGECHRIRGRSLQAVYHAHRDLGSLQDSITALVEATRIIPRSSPTLGLAYNDLGNAYALLQEYEDARANLGLSIGAYKSAMDVFNELLRSNPGLKSSIAMIYNSLGQAMWLRSRRFHNESDVSFALDCFKKSIQEIDEEHPAFALRVSNLSCASWVRYEATGSQELLVEADNEIQRALNASITLAPDIISSLKTQRGIMALQLAKKATPQQVAAYDRALTLLREALELDAREVRNVTLATILVDLALAQEGKAKLSRETQDFEDAFETFQRAEDAVPKNDPVHWVARFNHTGLRHNVLMELEHPGGLAKESLSTRGPSVLASWMSLADDASIFTSFRLEAASGAAVLAQILGRNVVALSYQKLALQLLPQIVAGSMTRPEQLRLIRKHYGIPFVGAMLSLAAGDPASEAIRLFESGRSFLWDRLLIQKTPIEELAQAHPQLAAAFDAARAAIAAGGSHSAIRLEAQFIGAVRAPGHLDREEKWRIYEEVLQSIRHEPGFEDFMRLPSQPESLEKYAVDAPIVYVNAHQWRSDALVIARDRVYNVALPLFTMQDIERRALDMIAARHALGQGPQEAARGMDQFDDIMAWLWDAVARPILDSTDLSRYPKIGQARKPKVIWVAAGWVNILPIHAAGRYGSRGAQGAPSCVHDVVVSAYTTSLRALKYSRERELLLRTRELSVSSPTPPQKMLFVAMEHTTGRNDLPEAVREVTAVKERLGPGVDCTILEHPDVRTTKAALAGADLAYFACHSQASYDDPSQSAILLGDGRPESLSVRVLLNTAMERCALVYLSSCESGLNKDFLLSEEGLSVAGAFHMAGVPHAVSSLWQVDDVVAYGVATKVFEYLDSVGAPAAPGRVACNKVVEALDASIDNQRRMGTRSMLWGPFIYTGC